MAANDLEALPELVLQLPLPLEAEVGRSDDQDALDETPDLQLLDEEPRHDGLPRARVVGQQEPDTWDPQEVVVDRLQLVRQRIDAGDGEAEVGVVLVGEAEAHGLDAEAETGRVAIVRRRLRGRLQLGDLGGGKDRLVDLPGGHALTGQLDPIAKGDHRDDPDRLW